MIIKPNFIWFPAYSVGPLVQSFQTETKNRFYDKESDSPFKYPYLLLSAGHCYNKENFAEKIHCSTKKNILFGDSGGFQIATKKIKYSDEVREKIFNWLENNTTIAANLDIPPYVSAVLENKTSTDVFNECLDISYDNFKYFNEKQSGKTKFLNILQGRNSTEWDKWYNKVKDFEFNGWCHGGVSASYASMLQSLFYLLDKGEMSKANNKFFHVLGTSKTEAFIYLIFFAYMLKKKRGINVFITSDSSTPSRTAAFGVYLISHNFISFRNLIWTNKVKKEDINPEGSLPCNCPICKEHKLDEIYNWNTNTYNILSMHNMYKLIDYIDFIKKIMEVDNIEVIYSFFPAFMVKQLKTIEKAFDSIKPVEFLMANDGIFENITEQHTCEEFF